MESTTDNRPRRLRSTTEGHYCGSVSVPVDRDVEMLKRSDYATFFEIVTQAIDEQMGVTWLTLVR
jgi:hypothetical protein